MKILHIIDRLSKTAGTGAFCGEVANRLVAAGERVAVAVRVDLGVEGLALDPRVRIVDVEDVIAGRVAENWDIAHIHACWQYFLHRAQKRMRKLGVPVVLSPHGALQPWALRYKWHKKVAALALWQYRDLMAASAVHACSDSERNSVHRLMPWKRVIEDPLGVVCRWTVDELRNQKMRRTRSRRTILFLSRIHPSKGLFNLVAAWAALKKSHPKMASEWMIRVVGEDYANHLKDVRACAVAKGCAEDIEFVGPKYGNDKDLEYAMADIFVSPTYSENFGAVVLEALACCTPVVITKGAPWSVLEERRCGRWIDIGAASLRDALIDMMQKTDDERLEMGLRGYQMVSTQYSWEGIVQRLREQYRQLIAGEKS